MSDQIFKKSLLESRIQYEDFLTFYPIYGKKELFRFKGQRLNLQDKKI